MNVLSLFDGISCGRVALERAGIPIGKYFASEIDKHAVKVSGSNYPDIIQIGDVTKVSYHHGVLYTENGNHVVKIDILIGGSPCQSLSGLGDGSGLNGKSGLFFHYLRIRDEIRAHNPDMKYLLENVVGQKKGIQQITDLIGVKPTMIDSNRVSAQNRRRYYWTNIEGVAQPEDKGILLTDILDTNPEPTAKLTPSRMQWLLGENGQRSVAKRYTVIDGEKAACLTARSDASWNCNYVTRNGMLTKLSCEEYERLQTLPVGYTKVAAPSQRYKMLGNGWTVDVIAHIFKNLRAKEQEIHILPYEVEEVA